MNVSKFIRWPANISVRTGPLNIIVIAEMKELKLLSLIVLANKYVKNPIRKQSIINIYPNTVLTGRIKNSIFNG